MEVKNSGRNGMGLLDVLLVIFIVLKVLGLITWPWYIVLIPLWIQLTFLAVVIILTMIVSGKQDGN